MNITYLHGEPTPRKELEPFDVVQGSFHAQLYDINSLLDLPPAGFTPCERPQAVENHAFSRMGK